MQHTCEQRWHSNYFCCRRYRYRPYQWIRVNHSNRFNRPGAWKHSPRGVKMFFALSNLSCLPCTYQRQQQVGRMGRRWFCGWRCIESGKITEQRCGEWRKGCTFPLRTRDQPVSMESIQSSIRTMYHKSSNTTLHGAVLFWNKTYK
jgi:hypothetical protein